MKKVISVLAILLLISTQVFAAAATVTKTEYGYSITGGNSATLVPADTWVTSTAYQVGQKVTVSGVVYKCLIGHTSGTFATDKTAGDWTSSGPKAVLWIGMVNFTPVAAATDIASFTSGASDNPAFILNQYCPNISFPMGDETLRGQPLSNLKVTLTAATDVVNVFVYNDNFLSPYAN